jgi:hypothetical protein
MVPTAMSIPAASGVRTRSIATAPASSSARGIGEDETEQELIRARRAGQNLGGGSQFIGVIDDGTEIVGFGTNA